MTVQVRCPNPACGKTAEVPEERLGHTARCGRCGQRFTLTARGPEGPSTVAPGARETVGPAAARSPGAAGVPRQVGRFQVRARLGAGAFGTVYRAYDPQLDREVALKVPQPGTLDEPRAADRFLREARAAARLHHPHIVPVYDAGSDGSHHYIASGFIDGRTLAHALNEGPFDCRRAAEVVRDLADALDHAHRQGIVHRDVKPANVLLDAQGQPHVTDFGLAHRQDTATRLTQEGAILGTPAYMAPQEAAGRHGEAAPASDQYSLGVVLYELLCGQTPFAGPPQVVLYNILNTDPPPPRSVRPKVSPALEAVCLRAMARRPEDRYPSCREFADDLRRWLAGEPWQGQQAQPLRFRREWVAALAGLAVGVGACLVFAVVIALRMRSPAPVASAPAPVAAVVAAETAPAPPEVGRDAATPLPAPKATAPESKPPAVSTPSGPMQPPLPTPAPVERHEPHVLAPTELRAAAVLTKLRACVLSADRRSMFVLTGAGGSVPGGMKGPGMPRMPGGPANAGTGPAAAEGEWVPLDGWDAYHAAHRDARPADQPLPLRMVVIAGSFPFRKQLEECRRAAGLKTLEDVAGDPGAQPQFLGLEVHRAEFRPGQVDQWVPLYPERTVEPLLRETLGRVEADPADLAALAFDGLVMPRPALFSPPSALPDGGPAKDVFGGAPPGGPGAEPAAPVPSPPIPAPERDLVQLADSLKAVKDAGPGRIFRPSNRFAASDALAVFRPGGTPRDDGLPVRAGPGPGAAGPLLFADTCLLRFLDTTVEPGKDYKYRVRVKVANPLTLPGAAAGKELLSEWKYLRGVVHLPSELHYYAVDIKVQEPKNRDFYSYQPADMAALTNHVPAQIHRWLERVYDEKNPTIGFPVGDWVIAERTYLTRGEYIRRKVDVRVPVWDMGHDVFTLAYFGRSGPRSWNNSKVPVSFGDETGAGDPILVDFRGGTQILYDRLVGMENDKPEFKPIRDPSASTTPTPALEMLFLMPDGKLLVHDGVKDAEAYKERYEQVKKRLEEIKNQKEPRTTPNKAGGKPFNK